MIGSAPFVGLVSLVRQPWLATRVRVRQWGRLARRRGPTLVIANHQHEDEAEILIERIFVQGPFRAALTASTRRMYEPGFFAERMPWSARLTRTLNAAPLFLALGMLPIENELGSRPLGVLAREVAARHGDLALDAVFRAPALAPLAGRARRLSELAQPALATLAATRTKLAHLHEPYRAEALAALRAGVEADVARIAEAVRAGATFFVTPEGFYSGDGRMRPLRGIVERLTPLADVRLAAIAFDPFRGRRLSLLYRIVAPADPERLGDSLAAARPITTSALLAEWLAARGEASFRPADAVEAVARAQRALPRGTFTDPELTVAPERCVAEALAVLRGRGTLADAGNALRLTARRGDRRFPLTHDMVAYQATFLGETRAAAQRLAERGIAGFA